MRDVIGIMPAFLTSQVVLHSGISLRDTCLYHNEKFNNDKDEIDEMDDYLFKFFEKPEYVEEFRKGRIRLMSAYYYATLEQSTQLYNNRFDSTEGKSFLFHNTNPEKEITLSFANGVTMQLGRGVQSIVFNSGEPNEQIKLSCYYALKKEDFPDGKFKTALDTMQDSLGDYYIAFCNPAAFVYRVQDSIDKMKKEGKVLGFSFKTVRYYDTERLNGFSYPLDKPDGLSWQREYRLIVNTVKQADPFYIDIGSLEDITIWGKKIDLENGFVEDETNIFIPNHLR